VTADQEHIEGLRRPKTRSYEAGGSGGVSIERASHHHTIKLVRLLGGARNWLTDPEGDEISQGITLHRLARSMGGPLASDGGPGNR
jgi:hypothetical protein